MLTCFFRLLSSFIRKQTPKQIKMADQILAEDKHVPMFKVRNCIFERQVGRIVEAVEERFQPATSRRLIDRAPLASSFSLQPPCLEKKHLSLPFRRSSPTSRTSSTSPEEPPRTPSASRSGCSRTPLPVRSYFFWRERERESACLFSPSSSFVSFVERPCENSRKEPLVRPQITKTSQAPRRTWAPSATTSSPRS